MEKKLNNWYTEYADLILVAVLAAMVLTIILPMLVHAAGYEDLINNLIIIVCSIMQVVGVIFGVVGIVRFVIAHANEQGGDQQRAALFIATGVVLVGVPEIIKNMDWAHIVNPTVPVS